jgi:hypothetical protein
MAAHISFEDRISPEPNSGCWLWDGNLSDDRDGYCRIKLRGRTYRAHRLAYERYRGMIPAGMAVCHHCDVRSCVNPDHLFLGKPVDNIADMVRKGREARGSNRGAAKLLPEQVLAIRAALGTNTALARQFGVTRRTIQVIRLRETWKHL